nr:S8 family serine peptidase [Motilibacter aurantiacus]
MRALALAAAALLPAAAVPGPASAVEPDRECATTPDEETAEPWQLRRLQPGRAWHLSQGGGVTVGVVDSGVDASSAHLRGAVVRGPDLLGAPGGPSTQDCSGHGTQVASLIAGRVLPGTPFAGIAPAARVLSIRQTEDVDGRRRGDTAGLARAIRAAADAGARVVNVSATSDTGTPALRAAVRYATARDVLVVAAAGNDEPQARQRTDATYYPAAYPEVLAVASTGPDDARADTSHAAGYVDIGAPGADVVTAGPNGPGRYAVATGTSFAAPLVAGAAALVRAYRPGLTAAQVKARIEATATPPALGARAGIGAGVLDVYAAVAATLPGERAAASREPAGARAPAVVAGPVLAPEPAPRARPGRAVAAALAAGGLAAALLALGLVAAARRGRARAWRPGRLDDAPAAVRADSSAAAVEALRGVSPAGRPPDG